MHGNRGTWSKKRVAIDNTSSRVCMVSSYSKLDDCINFQQPIGVKGEGKGVVNGSLFSLSPFYLNVYFFTS